MVDLPDTLEDLPDTMVDLSDTMEDIPDTIVDLLDTMVDRPDTMVDLSDTLVDTMVPGPHFVTLGIGPMRARSTWRAPSKTYGQVEPV